MINEIISYILNHINLLELFIYVLVLKYLMKYLQTWSSLLLSLISIKLIFSLISLNFFMNIQLLLDNKIHVFFNSFNDYILDLINNHFYKACFASALLDSEFIFLLLAVQKKNTTFLITTSFIFSFINNILLYYIGHLYLHYLVEKYSFIKKIQIKIEELEQKYENNLIIASKFLPITFVKTLLPLFITNSNITLYNFLKKSFIAQLCWVLLYSTAAYLIQNINIYNIFYIKFLIVAFINFILYIYSKN